jgi:2-methylcitrate dehydratase PrpD
LLAKEGQTATRDVFEHHQGFMEVFNGAGNYDLSRVLAGWASPYDVVSPGIAFKRYPCCASTHPAIDATDILRREHDLDATNVKSLLSLTHPRRFKHTNRPEPRSGFDGKFSVQYVVARMLLSGTVSLSHFSDEAVCDPQIQELLANVVKAEPHPKARADDTKIYYAEVMLETTDGRTLTKFIDAPVGRDRDHPLPPGALEAKFDDCAGQVLDTPTVEAVRALLQSLDKINDIALISRHIEQGTRPIDRTLASVA